MGGASILLVGLEATMEFSKHTPIIRGNSPYGNGREYERDAVKDTTLNPRNIDNTIGIAYLHALYNRYGNSRTRCRRRLNEGGEGVDDEGGGDVHLVSGGLG